jgi:hypothetical protein
VRKAQFALGVGGRRAVIGAPTAAGLFDPLKPARYFADKQTEERGERRVA